MACGISVFTTYLSSGIGARGPEAVAVAPKTWWMCGLVSTGGCSSVGRSSGSTSTFFVLTGLIDAGYDAPSQKKYRTCCCVGCCKGR